MVQNHNLVQRNLYKIIDNLKSDITSLKETVAEKDEVIKDLQEDLYHSSNGCDFENNSSDDIALQDKKTHLAILIGNSRYKQRKDNLPGVSEDMRILNEFLEKSFDVKKILNSTNIIGDVLSF